MKHLFLFAVLVSASAHAQTATESVVKKLGLYVFPSKNQTPEQQSKDESACYSWAVTQSGVDPVNPPKVEAKQVDKSADGTTIRGSAKGAAAGAAIGAIAGDAGKGAAIGAVAGAIGGRRAKVAGDYYEQEANNKAAAEEQAELMDNFKKAFAACLEGKGYTVK